MFDVLLYLFENFISEYPHALPEEPAKLVDVLSDAGFQDIEINKAFMWLKALPSSLEKSPASLENTSLSIQKPTSFRVFNPEEYARLGHYNLGFLLRLEQYSLIDSFIRELILDRLLALESFQIDIEKIKWVILIIAYHQYQDKAQLMFIEELLFIDKKNQPLH